MKWTQIVDRIATGILVVAAVGAVITFLVRPVPMGAREAIADRWWPEVRAEGESVGGGATPNALIVEFLDYQCHYCQESGPVLDAWLAEESGNGLLIRHTPTRGASSTLAAQMMICAAQARPPQDEWVSVLHRALLAFFQSGQRDLSTDSPEIPWAARADADMEACLTSPETTARIERDKALSDGLGLPGTPAFVSGSGLRLGQPTVEELRNLVGAS